MNGDTRQRCVDSLGLKLALAIAVVALLVGCGEPPDVLEAAVSFAGKVSDAATSAAELDSSSVLAALIDAEDVSPENEPTGSTPQRGVRTYYQFIDDRGSVRFVSTLAEVPEPWRERAGSVELSSPPPTSPADREADFERRRPRARAALAAAETTRRQSDLDVQLYFASWCGYCKKARAHLDDRGIDYELLDVDRPEIMAQLKSRTGSGSIPVLDVGGEIVRGYDPVGIDRLLAKL